MNCSKKEKSPWIKTKAKPGPKKKKKDFLNKKKRKNLAECDKGSWFEQPARISHEDVEKAVSSSPASLTGDSRTLKIIAQGKT